MADSRGRRTSLRSVAGACDPQRSGRPYGFGPAAQSFGGVHDAQRPAPAQDRAMSNPHRLLTPAFALVLGTSLAYFLAFAAGIVAASFSVTALLLRPWAARMADRRGRPAAMAGGAALAALAAAGAVLAPSLAALVALRIVAGA